MMKSIRDFWRRSQRVRDFKNALNLAIAQIVRPLLGPGRAAPPLEPLAQQVARIARNGWRHHEKILAFVQFVDVTARARLQPWLGTIDELLNQQSEADGRRLDRQDRLDALSNAPNTEVPQGDAHTARRMLRKEKSRFASLLSRAWVWAIVSFLAGAAEIATIFAILQNRQENSTPVSILADAALSVAAMLMLCACIEYGMRPLLDRSSHSRRRIASPPASAGGSLELPAPPEPSDWVAVAGHLAAALVAATIAVVLAILRQDTMAANDQGDWGLFVFTVVSICGIGLMSGHCFRAARACQAQADAQRANLEKAQQDVWRLEGWRKEDATTRRLRRRLERQVRRAERDVARAHRRVERTTHRAIASVPRDRQIRRMIHDLANQFTDLDETALPPPSFLPPSPPSPSPHGSARNGNDPNGSGSEEAHTVAIVPPRALPPGKEDQQR